MWVYFEKEEFEVIESLLEQSGLNGLKALIKAQLFQDSPKNLKHKKNGAIDAAKTYFAANDLEIDDYVKWDNDGNAHVLSWQKVPKEFIVENSDCGCKK
jgi:hypothetical protein